MTAATPYIRTFRTFARNCLVRDMTFRWNFITQMITWTMWMTLQLVFFVLIFQFTDEIGQGTGWYKYEYFVFLATSMFVSSLVQGIVMPNAEEFSDMIRKGNLDFALLKPIDTQFLVSFQRVNWASGGNFLLGAGLLTYSLIQLDYTPGLIECLLYPLYVLVGVAIMYSILFCLASTAVWFGRNESVLNMWFYITIFSRYPLEIYHGNFGTPLRQVFTWGIPVLVAINVPARFLAKPLREDEWVLAAYALGAAAVSLLIARWVFYRSLRSYRSASS